MDVGLRNFAENGINLVYMVRPINELYGTYWNEFGESDEYPDGHLEEWSNYIKAFVERYDGDGIDDVECSPKAR
ncbi:MAG: hypothetical protein KKB90_12760 [Actinobacteria bacterium]|nr:hypothetical protein [Actinomycetota bacterium]MBU4219810.1 hypothetical protein [Actinomycetota bacterium]MBU4358540.1 hypothetical protein [Actinomycetota bacterium]MCG2817423.1 hypothetical protein [Actinomycetes bacterium]